MLAVFRRPFSLKALPGLLLILLPVVEFFAMGYKMACASTAMRGTYALPEWKNWKEMFKYGFFARLIQAVWLTPAASVFAYLWFKIKSTIAPESVFVPETFSAISNLLVAFLVLLIIAAIFAPASVLNFVAEGKFKSAFSMSMLKRLASKAYALGWFIAGFYAVLIAAVVVGILLFIGTLTQISIVLTGLLVMAILLVLLWFPSITVWTILGEAWANAYKKEYYG